MGRLERFLILFDKPTAVYFPGETLTGIVEIGLRDSMKIKEVTIRLLGVANVSWDESDTDSDNNSTSVTYSNHELYFDCKIPLWRQGGPNSDKLPAGDHRLYFSFCLPLHIPTSFEGSVGYVRYTAEAVMNIPWRFNKKCKVPFSVNAVYDLNRMESAMQPVTDIGEKYLCCWCCRSGPISVIATIDRAAYVPGEVIRLNAEITNRSDREVNSSEVVFQSVIKYHARTKTRTEIKDISRLSKSSIRPGGSDVWFGEAIPIPSIPPSELAGCKIIDISYQVSVIVNPSGIATKLGIVLPLVIGTVPIRSYPVYQSSSMSMPSAPPEEYGGQSPPPSYAECVFGMADIRGTDDQYTHGKMNYAPMYSYYKEVK